MKSSLKLTALSALALASAAYADTEIRLTGSTAFRSSIHASLLASSNGVFTGGPTKYAHSNTAGNVSGASRSTWVGTVAGISGTTTIRCSWSGSATGINTVANSLTNQNFLATPVANGETPSAGSGTAMTSQIAMSDVYQASTSFTSPSLNDIPVAVVPFSFVVNDAADANNNAISNVTAQAARALWSSGTLPSFVFTGVSTNTRSVYAIGRDTGSGTRITALAETKYGVNTPLQHWQITASSGAVTHLRVWPTNAQVANNGGDTLAANGGYTSGGTLATGMSNTSRSGIQLVTAAGVNSGAADKSAILMSCVGMSDAATIVTGGGKYLSYEGVSFTNITSPTDIAKVTQGQYTMWGYQHMFDNNALDADQTAARDAIISAIPNNLGTSGIDINAMAVGRGEDGGLVGP